MVLRRQNPNYDLTTIPTHAYTIPNQLPVFSASCNPFSGGAVKTAGSHIHLRRPRLACALIPRVGARRSDKLDQINKLNMAPPSSTNKPLNAYRMTATLKNLYYKLTPTNSTFSLPTTKKPGEFTKAPTGDALFTKTDPALDGDECLHDCASCTVKYPSKFSIDETEELYGHVKGWSTHLIVATGKTDWVRDVADEKGSIMEAVDKATVKPSNGVGLSSSRFALQTFLADLLTPAPNALCLQYTRP
jgi:hypothetical protein